MIDTPTGFGFSVVSVGTDGLGRRHPSMRLTDRQVLEIRGSNEDNGLLALCYGVSIGHVRMIKTGTKRKNANKI
jgi:hypothetical protein